MAFGIYEKTESVPASGGLGWGEANIQVTTSDIPVGHSIVSAGYSLVSSPDSLIAAELRPIDINGGVAGVLTGWVLHVFNMDTVAHDATLYVTYK